MSNVIKFERPPEQKPPKPQKSLSPTLKKVIVWVAIVAALVLVWGYYTLVGGTGAPA
ncbi:hypothetical protein [Rhizobium rosettiformans]|jgi:hypothetical protein|uniref:hypothetical protein n=1 Tax=Rhizobium rosettiformans TaxID=1368430 RepID=UPI002854CF52|nr:hypothetical protein [Rhizobium rosettiformans]MDR7028459.1 hypothetical protein [Rhizobium rosettiformans]MDR7064259.1 hypothetical protein [Rhizobium rosettiformans]